MPEEKNSTSVKELAAKLQASDALLKKIIKDFEIDTTKLKNRVHLTDSSVQTVKEIIALRATGKKTKEIKELFDASKESATKEKPKAETKEVKNTESKEVKDTGSKDLDKKDVKDQTDTPKPLKKKKKKLVKVNNEDSTQDDKKSDLKEVVTKEANEKEASQKEVVTKEVNEKEASQKEVVAKEANTKEDQRPSSNNNKDRNNKRKPQNKKQKPRNDNRSRDNDKSGMMNLNEYIDGNDHDNDFKAKLNFDDEAKDESEILENFDDDLNIDDDDNESPKTNSNNKNKKEKFRRRQFSYKYIQRQIMNDQKRVQYIQQKLLRGRLSTKEKMHLEESLEIRDKLLAGWVKLLRWVKS